MSDALLSAPVAVGAGVAAVALLGVAGARLKRENRPDLVSLMGVMGAFVFAAQMVNFSIPGTGSSGHIVGGVLLAAMLGPWAAFVTLASVLVIQCLVFADGGLMALSCNIINMGAMTCLVAYPLVFKPLVKYPASVGRVMWVSVLACVVGLELGAALVTAETAMSHVTALSGGQFLALMGGIHLPIGICEGLATGAVICFVQKTRPAILTDGVLQSDSHPAAGDTRSNRVSGRRLAVIFAVAAAVIGGGIAFLASSDPDGLEWSILKVTGGELSPEHASALGQAAGQVQASTAFMPDYSSPLSGIIGACVVMLLVWAVTSMLVRRRKVQPAASAHDNAVK